MGKIEVEGTGTLRDAKLFPGGAREWDWRETGTEHTLAFSSPMYASYWIGAL